MRGMHPDKLEEFMVIYDDQLGKRYYWFYRFGPQEDIVEVWLPREKNRVSIARNPAFIMTTGHKREPCTREIFFYAFNEAKKRMTK